MKVAIRLALHGCCNRPFYHLVAIPHRRSRNGRILEQLGTYDPMPNTDNEKLVAINYERLRYWMASGAEPSKPVQILLGLAGFLPIYPALYIRGKRRIKLAEDLAGLESVKTEENHKAQS